MVRRLFVIVTAFTSPLISQVETILRPSVVVR